MAEILGIGIESSCDETGVTLIKNGKEVIKNSLFSQIELHKEFGGVVPENASRAHLEKIPWLIQDTIDAVPSNASLQYIAVTARPGLVGSLLVGFNAALALGAHYNIPVIPVHHLEAHLYAVLPSGYGIPYPFLGLLLSGGNSALYHVTGLGQIEVIADTFDDAAGEALDKAASILGLPYPGGPHIEKAAAIAEPGPDSNPLPRVLKDQKDHEFNFSFSGLKTALLYLTRSEHSYTTEQLAFYFQQRVFEAIIRNTTKAAEHLGLDSVIAAGGVMANSTLRESLQLALSQIHTKLIVPEKKFCTDNAAMVAALGHEYFQTGRWPQPVNVSSENSFRQWGDAIQKMQIQS